MQAQPLRFFLRPLFALLCATPHLFAVDAEGVTEDKSASPGLKPYDRKAETTPADSAPAAQKGFRRAKVPAGFEGSLWATEPLLANPVAFSFDGQGRMYIAETHRYRTSVLDIRHYMFMLEDDLANRNQADWERSIKKNFPKDWQELGKETEVVRLVQDKDGNGTAETSSVYADGFNSILDGIASGVLARPEGVWLANIPGLYKLQGTEKAEKKEELFRGFGIRFNYTGHDLHGLIKGPDGRIYFSIGDRGASVTTKEGHRIDLPDEGAIFRCEEDGSNLEIVMRGMRNPQELAFDDHGNLFTCDNDSDQGDRERLVYVIEGGDAGWRVGYQHCPQGVTLNPWLAEAMWEPRESGKNQPAYILSPLANMPDGPGGLIHYPGTGLPEKYKGCYFVACYKGTSATSQVAAFRPVPEGASFKLEMQESFLPGCQATDVDFGPDSALYVSFWDEGWERTAQGRILKLEHAESRKAQAAQIAEVKDLLGKGMKSRPVAELTGLLGHADQRIRLEAQWELANREIFEISAATNNLAELHQIWLSSQIARRTKDSGQKSKIAAQLAKTAETAKNPETLAQSIKALGELKGPVEPILAALGHANGRVRLFAAQALGKLPPATTNVNALLAQANKDAESSQEFRTAAAVSLGHLAKADSACLEALMKNADQAPIVSMMAGARIGGTQGATLTARFLHDERFQDECARILTTYGLEDLLEGGASSKLGTAAAASANPLTRLRAYNAYFRHGTEADAFALAGALFDESKPTTAEVNAQGMAMLGKWWGAGFPQRHQVHGNYSPLPKREGHQASAASAFGIYTKGFMEKDLRMAEATLETARRLKAKTFASYAVGLKLPTKARLLALHVAAEVNAENLDAVLAQAVQDPESAVRIAAAGILSKSNPKLAVQGLSAALAEGNAEDQRAAYTALKALQTPEADAIVEAQLVRLKEGKVPALAHLELLELAQASSAPAIKTALAAYQASLSAEDKLSPYLMCLEGGDPESGKKIYSEHPVAACRRCHTINRSGGEAGPALDAIALKKDARYLLESIVEPNAQIAESFRMLVVNLKDGNVKTGVWVAETAESLTIQMPGEQPEAIPTAAIASKEAIPSGMMPGLGLLLSKRELRDLVAYLSTLTEPLK